MMDGCLGLLLVPLFYGAIIFMMLLILAFPIEEMFAVCVIPGQDYVSYETIGGGYCSADPPSK